MITHSNVRSALDAAITQGRELPSDVIALYAKDLKARAAAAIAHAEPIKFPSYLDSAIRREIEALRPLKELAGQLQDRVPNGNLEGVNLGEISGSLATEMSTLASSLPVPNADLTQLLNAIEKRTTRMGDAVPQPGWFARWFPGCAGREDECWHFALSGGLLFGKKTNNP
jgi:hypothetical protein